MNEGGKQTSEYPYWLNVYQITVFYSLTRSGETNPCLIRYIFKTFPFHDYSLLPYSKENGITQAVILLCN